MIPILSIVGWTNSGKTTFITKLIPELKKRGYKIATIKHNAHKFSIDKQGKDSWKHRQAGAETVILSSKDKIAVIKEVKEEVMVEKLVESYIDEDFDLVIVEGYKTGATPKIEVFRPKSYDKPVFSKKDLLAQVINDYDSPDELSSVVEKIVGVIEKEIIDKY